jgi:hypothetical protein
MHNKHFLHLPVAREDGQVAGLIDVLQLTLAVTEGQSTTIHLQRYYEMVCNHRQYAVDEAEHGSEDGSWRNFWDNALTSTPDDETASNMSNETTESEACSRRTPISRSNSRTPSVCDSVYESLTLKVKCSSGQVHRFTTQAGSLTQLREMIAKKFDLIEDGSLCACLPSYISVSESTVEFSKQKKIELLLLLCSLVQMLPISATLTKMVMRFASMMMLMSSTATKLRLAASTTAPRFSSDCHSLSLSPQSERIILLYRCWRPLLVEYQQFLR